MSDDETAYGEPNDLGPDVPAPRAPRGPPSRTTPDYRIWAFEAEDSETVPDTYVVSRDPTPLDFRMWIFAGRGNDAVFVVRSSHRFGPDATVDSEDCCEVLVEGASLTADHGPDAVATLVADLTGVTVEFPDADPSDHRDGSVRY